MIPESVPLDSSSPKAWTYRRSSPLNSSSRDRSRSSPAPSAAPTSHSRTTTDRAEGGFDSGRGRSVLQLDRGCRLARLRGAAGQGVIDGAVDVFDHVRGNTIEPF